MLINKNIHKKFSNFSEDYKISSDYDFYLRLKKKNFKSQSKTFVIKKQICKIGREGISSRKYFESILEKIDIEKKFKVSKVLFLYIKNFIIYIIMLIKML